MRSRRDVEQIVQELCANIAQIFPQDRIDAILFGSYARGDAEQYSDIDVLVLVDSSRQTVSQRNWQIGEVAAELLLSYGVVVSPIVENREYYAENADILPFYQNIQREGVRIDA